MTTFKKNTIGICGHGFVGEAIEAGMQHACDVFVYDPHKYMAQHQFSGKHGHVYVAGSIRDLVDKAEVIFVCVPTPMQPDGSASIEIVENVVADIVKHATCETSVVIKSTVPPGTTHELNRRFNSSIPQAFKGIVFNPEFLTEANYIDDFKNQNRIIIGASEGSRHAARALKSLYRQAYPNVPIYETTTHNAEMVKYVANCFLATKVSFANEIFQLCESFGRAGADIDYNDIIQLTKLDDRLGSSHWQVPGPDLKRGFGLSCFPKDINALISCFLDNDVEPSVLKAVWKKNLEVRPEEDRDWESMPKAVVNVKKE